MPTPVSRIEIAAGSVGFVGGLPAGTGAEASRGLACFDSSTLGVHYGLIARLTNNATATDLVTSYAATCFYPFNPSYTSGDVKSPELWQAIFIGMTSAVYEIVVNDSGAGWLAGGTLAIEKDYDANVVRFITPAGTMTVPLDTVAPATVGPISNSPGQSGFWHTLYWGGLDPSISVSESALWTDFWFSSNSVHVDGAAMTAADPGFWEPPIALWDQPPASDAQHTLGYLAQFTYSPPPTVHDNGHFSEYREWGFSTRGAGIASVRLPEHGTIMTAYAGPADLTAINVTVTFDNGRTNPAFPVVAGGTGAMPRGVSIAWSGQRAYVVYGDAATGLMQTESFDFGQTWSTPVSFSITGTNPTTLVDPFHGIQFYFYIDVSGNLQLVRSADHGQTFIDAAPLLVAAAIGPQNVGAQFTSDGNLLVNYLSGGALAQLRSLDYGLTWS